MPSGTCTAYLSCAEIALAPKTVSAIATAAPDAPDAARTLRARGNHDIADMADLPDMAEPDSPDPCSIMRGCPLPLPLPIDPFRSPTQTLVWHHALQLRA